MKKLLIVVLAFPILGMMSCDDELVAVFPECHINLTGTLKVVNTFDEDYILYIDTQYRRMMEPGDEIYMTFPQHSGINVWMKEVVYDSVQNMYKGYFYITECDTIVCAPIK